MQYSTTKAGLRGIHAVGGGVAWASGTDGTVLRTLDGGETWQACATPPGAEKLDFRGIWAWDAETAVAMSSGPGELSRLYKTVDGCSSWKLLYTNPDKNGFWDAVAFEDRDSGLLLGDPVAQAPVASVAQATGVLKYPADKSGVLHFSRPHFLTLETHDGGLHWLYMPAFRGLNPEPGPKGGGAFAASNSSVFVPQQAYSDVGSGRSYNATWAWFGVGGAGGTFVYLGRDVSFHSPELGFAWSEKISVPLASGQDTTGVFSLAFRPSGDVKDIGNAVGGAYQHGIAVGGDYKKPEESTGTAAYTSDGGRTWTAAAKPPHGYRSAVAWDAADKAWIAAGTNGSDVSFDDGKTWAYLDSGKWNALSLPWVVGPEGRIGKLVSLNLVQSGSGKK